MNDSSGVFENVILAHKKSWPFPASFWFAEKTKM